MYVSIIGNYIDLSDGSYIFWGPSLCRLGAYHRYGMTHQREQGSLRLSHCVARLSHWAAHYSHCVTRLSHWAAHPSHCAAHHRYGVPTVVLGADHLYCGTNHLYRGCIPLYLGIVHLDREVVHLDR